MRIVVTVDTEADGQWRHGAPLTTENVLLVGAIPGALRAPRGEADVPGHQ